MAAAQPNIALVLTGGGARAAYQAGVVRALQKILEARTTPFRILTGISAGAINIASLASHADDFDAGTRRLWHFWKGLRFEDVIDTRALSFFGIGMRILRQLTMGGFLGESQASSNSLLDASPLRSFLMSKLDFAAIRRHLASGTLHSIATTVTDYFAGNSVTFYDAIPSVANWTQGFHLAVRAHLSLEHVLASSAIPIFFAPVRVGDNFYGDGGIRFASPLSPAIHLGADRILAVGVRHQRTPEESLAAHQVVHPRRVALADIAGILLNAIFLDSLDTDVQRLRRVNMLLEQIPESKRPQLMDGLRPIPLLAIKPSRDLGTLAIERLDAFPALLRHLLRGLGASTEKSWDLLSYLAFERVYASRLLRLGHDDVMARKDEIRDFIRGSSTP